MLVKASLNEKDRILSILKKKADLNLFFIADIEFFGIETDFMKVWVNSQFTTFVLKYNSNLLVYSEDNNYDKQEIFDLIVKENIKICSFGQDTYNFLKKDIERKGWNVRFETMAKMEKLVIPLPSIKVERAVKEDATKIVTALSKIDEFKELISGQIENRIKNTYDKIENGFCIHFIVREKGEIIANANTSAISSNSAMIGGVFTTKKYRNKGYGTAVVATLCDYLLKHNQTPVLFFENPKAASIYHRLGFVDFDKWFMLIIE